MREDWGEKEMEGRREGEGDDKNIPQIIVCNYIL